MTALRVLGLLIYTFGAFAYGTILFLAVRDVAPRGWAGQRRRRAASGSAAERPDSPTEAEVAGGAMLLLGFIWFVANAIDAMARMTAGSGESWLQVVVLWLAFLWPPLIMQVTLAELLTTDPARCAALKWPRRMVYVAWPLMLFAPAWATLAFFDVVPTTGRQINIVLNGGLTGAFVVASVFSVSMTNRFGSTRRTPRDRLGDRAMTAMFLITVVIFVLMPTIAVVMQANLGMVVGRVIEIAARSLPLAFLFVGAYFESRFDFFDVLVKRGTTLLLTIAALVVFFAGAFPWLRTFEDNPAAPWVYAVSLLPIALALPWLHGRVSSTLDRWWLGRRYGVVDAVKHFIATLRSATTDAQLVALAEQALAEIFAAPAMVRLPAEDRPPAFDVRESVPVRAASGEGTILMGQRASEAPYFSGDVALLDSLAGVLASVLDNLHLQARKQEQEQRAQELSLHASRSELKALRAQINPHFLFNALNAIAGLIHRNPDRADRTIEQLADVFRYALRGAESEWAVLDDEVEFVRAYLEVERARFGERLTVDIHVDPDALSARVPTMVIQTLVENAVKHGLSEVMGPALIGVRASREADRVVVRVLDNGEGFKERSTRRVADRRSGGYGLANIRQRLHGYFGADGSLEIERDHERGLTVVSVMLPFLREPPSTHFVCSGQAQ